MTVVGIVRGAESSFTRAVSSMYAHLFPTSNTTTNNNNNNNNTNNNVPPTNATRVHKCLAYSSKVSASGSLRKIAAMRALSLWRSREHPESYGNM